MAQLLQSSYYVPFLYLSKQHKAHQHGGISSPILCFCTKVNRVNSNTLHFSDKAKKLH